MAKPETIKDLLVLKDISEGDVKKIAAALWEADSIATEAFPAPYKVTLPDFESLPAHVQGFIVKGILDAGVTPTFREKDRKPLEDEPEDEDFEPPTVGNEVV